MRLAVCALSLSLSCLLAPSPVRAEDADAESKRADARRLIEVSGTGLAMRQSLLSSLDGVRGLASELPDAFFDEMKAAAMTDELVDLMIPVYERHFTHDEIRELIRVYESPIGKTLVRKQPLLMQDAMGVGEAWGKRKAEEIVRKLQEGGVAFPGQPEAEED